ncbi:VOC family protein [Nonomuraea roseoviolacea]|uniref:Enzyme related to lactoylglutathione lyase n=1 Tax=Nonomuraea roseoviolacea subsp. carminata TaxID=160689 RepID=A0ABT1KAI8_9ACTN|nr:VOC family protein [Nonomuraea roseoviolacea]MCP2351044.1 putative enzyme related to lactoylglutathione lyase [Nonomuraea roseoviolacea subsp. carminata]
MLRGFATVNLFADDLAAARDWYAELLRVQPYFEVPGPDGGPAYVEFRVGDYQHELGIVRGAYGPHGPGAGASGPSGAVLYWAVDDVEATLERLFALGAKEHQGVVDRGGNGFVTASVVDPFGNVLGIMTNPHYMEVLGARG